MMRTMTVKEINAMSRGGHHVYYTAWLGSTFGETKRVTRARTKAGAMQVWNLATGFWLEVLPGSRFEILD